MWIRMGTFRAKPELVETLVTTYNEHAVPKVRAVPGNIACMLLEPSESGDEYVVITIWNDRDSAAKYESSGEAAEVVALVRHCFAGPPTLRSFASGSEAGLVR
ncbi:MAG TPA: antibiotic biosynthesis monooxygenase [Polyangiaceae bacterium]|nr:antibiotic biosynthesis monooxygenase [Polyangiaceae bacterium]